MHYIYFQHLVSEHQWTIDNDEFQHIVKVLRHKEGDSLAMLNGNGLKTTVVIDKIDKKSFSVKKLNTQIIAPSNPFLEIAVAPTKNNARNEWFIEKAVELGVNKITFLFTQNSERLKLNKERLDKIAIAAIKQSKNCFLPQFQITDWKNFISIQHAATKLIAHCKEGNKLKFSKFEPSDKFLICIGPEGDFTKDEITEAERNGFTSIDLGNQILRTETAALAASAFIKLTFAT
jgi:16S rRNA (uracil1498-N3)-methyltransferase